MKTLEAVRGTQIAERFVIESHAGSGAMGHVFCARDELTGQLVALKVLAAAIGQRARDRFEREARVLEELQHSCIVRHVASGTTERGESYLAMEWLEGEDLAQRLDRGELALEDALRIGLQSAEALGAAHRRGIVHRDIKPSNLFLTGEDGLRVKIVDFGIALWGRTRFRPLTHDGALVGTPGYMAPEQGRGERVDARADVFALGCVLFECVTGLPAFVADSTTALLLKILVQDVPKLGEVVDDVPQELEDLVDRMVAKDVARRPRDGDEVAHELEPILEAVLASPVRRSWASPSERPPPMMGGEQRLLSVVLVSDPSGARAIDPDATLAEDHARETKALLAPIVDQLDCRVESLADGSVVAIVEGGAATDQAARAARCALAIRRVLGPLRTGIATGRARIDERLPVGPVIDRVASLVSVRGADGVRLDELTAGLLDARFLVGGDSRGLLLEGEREGADEERTLLGRITPYVGRAREQGMLEAVASECVEELVARAVLVTGPAGMGKSRLRRETVKRFEQQHPELSIWLMRADPLQRGSSFGLLADALHRQAGIHADEPLEVRQRKLRARVARHARADDVRRITEFLAEVAGAPFPEHESTALDTARRNASAMSDHVRRAMVDLLAAEADFGPVVLVIEDLQWADAPTLTLVGELLRELAETPLLVLGFARPEVDDAFPSLWEGRDVTRIPLSPLTRRAAGKLVRTVLGDVDDAHVGRLVELASGNPFLLEELMRAAAEGRWDDAPDTAIAVVQARLEALPAALRRVLRAASVFGDSCWRGGLVALLGPGAEREIDVWLAELHDAELLEPRSTSRFADDPELSFRHDLIREAAYAMLTDDSRTAGHKAAGAWLESKGELLPRVLAEHFERGGQSLRAAEHYLRAALQANAALDFRGTVEMALAGARCGATGELLGELRVAQAEAMATFAPLEEWSRVAAEGRSLVARGGPSWYLATRSIAAAATRLHDVETLSRVARELLEQEGEPTAERIASLGRVSIELFLAELGELGRALQDRMEQDVLSYADPGSPEIRALVHAARGRRALAENDRAAYAREMREAAELFDRAGNLRGACQTLANLGFSLLEIGRPAEAEAVTIEAAAGARRLGLEWVEALALHNLGLALAWRGKLEQALECERRAIEMLEARGEERLLGGAYGYLSTICSLADDHESAEAAARRAVALLEPMPPLLQRARAALAQALLGLGRAEEAREHARAAAEYLAREGKVGEGEGLVRLMDAETARAVGDLEAARTAAEAAAARLRERAAQLDDAEPFLRDVPEHARTLTLVEELRHT